MRIWSLLAILTASAAMPAVARAPAVAPHSGTPVVFLGGTEGLLSLADPAATTRFRATGRGGIYLHYSATGPEQFGAALTAIAKNFQGTGPAVAELGLFHRGFFTNEWRTNITAPGFAPNTAVINIPLTTNPAVPGFSNDDLGLFKAFVDEGRLAGVKVIAPVASPNMTGGVGPAGDAGTLAVARPWLDPWWDNVRTAALYGGGIAIDAPPAFYLHGLPDAVQVKAYQVFAQAQLAWAAQNKLAAFVIVSPFHDPGLLMQNAQRQYRMLLAGGALPTGWVVENYNTCGPPYPNACVKTDAAFDAPAGPETKFGSAASVALWFARFAKVRAAHGAP
jgi:hypothetical protein